MSKRNTIRCPHCNWEYLPGEIYVPKPFVGQPVRVVRDETGNILGFSGDDMDTQETYECDNCHTTFVVDAAVTFKTDVYNDIFAEDEEF